MRAIGYQTSLPSADPASLTDIDLPRPEPTGRDLLVRVEAVSVNPVDTKVRMRAQPEPGQWKVLGWDAAGTLETVGPEVTLFKPGEAVFYAGALGRRGRMPSSTSSTSGSSAASPPRSASRRPRPCRSLPSRLGRRSSIALTSASPCRVPHPPS
jgi:NADPH:quinone reductase-like Zn-dependent oxidoreductase